MWRAYLGFFLLGLALPIMYYKAKPKHYVIENEKSINFRVIEEMLESRNIVLKEKYKIYEDDITKGAIVENKRLLYLINNNFKQDDELIRETEEELEG